MTGVGSSGSSHDQGCSSQDVPVRVGQSGTGSGGRRSSHGSSSPTFVFLDQSSQVVRWIRSSSAQNGGKEGTGEMKVEIRMRKILILKWKVKLMLLYLVPVML